MKRTQVVHPACIREALSGAFGDARLVSPVTDAIAVELADDPEELIDLWNHSGLRGPTVRVGGHDVRRAKNAYLDIDGRRIWDVRSLWPPDAGDDHTDASDRYDEFLSEARDCRLTRLKLCSPGSIAGAILRAIGAEYHLTPSTRHIAGIENVYNGGRCQTYRQGRFPEMFVYDINAAYPWALSKLGCAREDWREEWEPAGPLSRRALLYRCDPGPPETHATREGRHVRWLTRPALIPDTEIALCPFPIPALFASAADPEGCDGLGAIRTFWPVARENTRTRWFWKVGLAATFGQIGSPLSPFYDPLTARRISGMVRARMALALSAALGTDAEPLFIATDSIATLRPVPELDSGIGDGLGDWKRTHITDASVVSYQHWCGREQDGTQNCRASSIPRELREWVTDSLLETGEARWHEPVLVLPGMQARDDVAAVGTTRFVERSMVLPRLDTF